VTEFPLVILAPDREWYSGPAVSVTAPGQDGEFGVLARHIPLVAGLKAGVAIVRLPGGKSLYVALDGGMLGVEDRGVRILTSQAVVCDTLERARAALATLARVK
jgi:F-type H+-transporting ATPase subunit epsilon